MDSNIIEIDSIHKFVEYIINLKFEKSYSFFYRGHSDKNFKMLPSIYRKSSKLITKEDLLIKEAILRNPFEFNQLKTNFEKLSLMQHYGFDTRLLDITENPLVALYFAVNLLPKKDGEVIILKIKNNNIKYYDSDVVSILSAIATISTKFFNDFNEELKNKIIEEEKKDKRFKEIKERLEKNKSPAIITVVNYMNSRNSKKEIFKRIVEIFNDTALIDSLIFNIKNEKPHFRRIIEPRHFNNYIVAVKAKYDNKRIVAQQGAFLLFGIKDGDKIKPAELNKNEIEQIQDRLIIPGNKKEKIIDELDKFGINEEKLFPELANSAKVIKKKLKI